MFSRRPRLVSLSLDAVAVLAITEWAGCYCARSHCVNAHHAVDDDFRGEMGAEMVHDQSEIARKRATNQLVYISKSMHFIIQATLESYYVQ